MARTHALDKVVSIVNHLLSLHVLQDRGQARKFTVEFSSDYTKLHVLVLWELHQFES